MSVDYQHIIEIEDLKVYFPVHQHILGNIFQRRKEYIHAVDGVSFAVKRGETFGLVGESGSGKTTLGRTLTLMVKPTSGKIFLDGENILDGNIKTHESQVRKRIQMIFQDPFSSLNPRKTVKQAIGVPLKEQGRNERGDVEEKIIELLELTGLHPSTRYMYPHELSGGQRQRVVIARALAAEPDFLIADEPVSKLDLSIKAQIINLFSELKNKMGLTMMFIAHDLRMAKHVSNTIAVMYHGHLMEVAEGQELFRNPVHPYTQTLLEAIPTLNPEHRKTQHRKDLKIQEISLINPPQGCRYSKSCSYANKECEGTPVKMEHIGGNHWVACHRFS